MATEQKHSKLSLNKGAGQPAKPVHQIEEDGALEMAEGTRPKRSNAPPKTKKVVLSDSESEPDSSPEASSSLDLESDLESESEAESADFDPSSDEEFEVTAKKGKKSTTAPTNKAPAAKSKAKAPTPKAKTAPAKPKPLPKASAPAVTKKPVVPAPRARSAPHTDSKSGKSSLPKPRLPSAITGRPSTAGSIGTKRESTGEAVARPTPRLPPALLNRVQEEQSAKSTTAQFRQGPIKLPQAGQVRISGLRRAK